MLKQPKPGVSADTATTPAPAPTAPANSGEPATSAEAGTATIADAQTSMPVAGGTTATVNNEPAADSHAETAFICYPDPLAPGGNVPQLRSYIINHPGFTRFLSTSIPAYSRRLFRSFTGHWIWQTRPCWLVWRISKRAEVSSRLAPLIKFRQQGNH